MRATACALLVMALGGCAAPGAQSEAETAATASANFTFTPQVGRTYKHRMTRYEEFAVVGSPLRHSEEWVIDWDVEVEQETNHFKIQSRLVGLQIKVNGKELLDGSSVEAKDAALEILLDKDANIADIRGTESLTMALVALAAPETKETVREIFSPERLKALFFQRVQERTKDLLGRPAQVGSRWMSNEGTGGVVTIKQLEVMGQEPCGDRSCVRVSRDYEVDKQAVWAIAEAKVAAWVADQGGNPDELKVDKAEIKLADELLVEPATMAFHHATFEQTANLKVSGYQNELEVQISSKRESTYTY